MLSLVNAGTPGSATDTSTEASLVGSEDCHEGNDGRQASHVTSEGILSSISTSSLSHSHPGCPNLPRPIDNPSHTVPMANLSPAAHATQNVRSSRLLNSPLAAVAFPFAPSPPIPREMVAPSTRSLISYGSAPVSVDKRSCAPVSCPHAKRESGPSSEVGHCRVHVNSRRRFPG